MTAEPGLTSVTQVYYDQLRRRFGIYRGCPGGQHVAFTTTDRAGTWFWACRNCPAVREQGTPGWTP